MPKWGIWGLILFATACGPSHTLSTMEPGETGRVTKVIDGDALILDTGQSVRLVSIEAPALYPRDRPPEPYAAESARTLEDLALGRKVQLFYPGLTRDRYDRALAHVLTIDGSGPKLWLNQEMLMRGAAWVRLYPDTAALGHELLENERAAQRTQTGLWASAAYQIADAVEVKEQDRGFRLIHARLGAPIPVDATVRYPPACMRQLEGADLRISVRGAARSACNLSNGTSILVRGYISDLQLDLTYPRHLEIVDEG